MGEKQQCSARIATTGMFYSHQCSRNGKVQREGKWYCNQHDPVRIEGWIKERDARWEREWAEKHKTERRRRAEEKACTGISTEELKHLSVKALREALAAAPAPINVQAGFNQYKRIVDSCEYLKWYGGPREDALVGKAYEGKGA